MTHLVIKRAHTLTGSSRNILNALQLPVVDSVAHDADLCADYSKAECNFMKAREDVELVVYVNSIDEFCSHQAKCVNQPSI